VRIANVKKILLSRAGFFIAKYRDIKKDFLAEQTTEKMSNAALHSF